MKWHFSWPWWSSPQVVLKKFVHFQGWCSTQYEDLKIQRACINKTKHFGCEAWHYFVNILRRVNNKIVFDLLSRPIFRWRTSPVQFRPIWQCHLTLKKKCLVILPVPEPSTGGKSSTSTSQRKTFKTFKTFKTLNTLNI